MTTKISKFNNIGVVYKKEIYWLGEDTYSIDGVWLYEYNELTGRLNIALLKECEIIFK